MSTVGQVNVKVTADTSAFQRSIEGLGRDAENAIKPLSEKLADVGKGFEQVGKDLTKQVTAPIVGLGGLTVKAFGDFDDKLNQSLAIQAPEVAEQFRGTMERTARDVALEFGMSAADVAESFFFLASAGLDAEQQIAALPQVAAFAKAGMFDMATATDLATDAQSALGLVSDDAAKNLGNLERVTDVLVGANTLANASVEQFSEALTNKAGAALRVVNKDVEEGAAVLAALADQGVKGAEAGEKLNVFLRDTARAASANSEEFEALGLSIFDADGNMRNMADIVQNMEEVFGDMSDAQMVATLDALGLNRSVADVSKQLMGTSDDIREYEAELRQMGGVTQDVAERQLDSFSGQMSIVKAELTDLALDIGPIVIDEFLKPLIDVVRDVVDRFSNMDERTRLLIVRIAGIAAAVGPVLLVVGKLLKITGAILGPLARFSGLLFKLSKAIIPPLIKAVMLLTKAMLANPFILIAVAVVALIAGIVLAYRRFETFRNIVDGVISAVRGFIEGFVEFFMDIWETILPVAEGVFEAIKVVVETVFEVIVGIIEVAIEVVTVIVETFMFAVELYFTIIRTIVETVFEVIVTIIETAIDVATAIFEVFQDVVEKIWDAIKKAAEFAFDLIQKAWEKLTGAIERAIEIARDIIEKVWDTVRGAGERAFELIQRAWEILTGAVERAIETASGIVTGVWDTIKGAAETAFEFISDAWDTLTGGIESAIETAKDFVEGAFNSIKDTGERIFDGIASAVTGAFESAINGAKRLINPFIRATNSVIGGLNRVPGVNIPTIPELLANGAIVGSPTLAIIGEAGSEAVIPLTRPRRAMELMEQSGLADMARSTGGGRGAAVNIEHATFVAPLDAEKVAQKVIVAEKARAFAA